MWRYNPNRKPPRKLNSRQAAMWMNSYGQLLAFVQREGHARIPRMHKEGDVSLRAWVDRQRSKWREGMLLEEHRELLEKVQGWEWGEEGVAQLPKEEEPRHGGHEWNFLVTSDGYRLMIMRACLLGKGAIPREEAIDLIIRGAVHTELKPERHLREGGRMHWLAERTIRLGLRQGFFDSPEPGLVRAIMRDASEYIHEDWERCVEHCDFSGVATRDAVVRRILEKAVELMGLNLSTVEGAPFAMKDIDEVIDDRGLYPTTR